MLGSKNQPNAEEKRWREDVRQVGCIACNASVHMVIIEIHHVAGRSAKFDKVSIGHWWILPLCTKCHQLIGNPSGSPDKLAMDLYGFAFVGRWDLEKLLFADLLTWLPGRVSHETLSAINRYRR